MAPAQRTFTLIPQAPGRMPSDAPRPARPMTSKQVQKAYKAANRGPRLSRAERIKQERAEQERIKKEFEKEKSTARAKAAREKKKEKELAEKEERRKKGLPLVNVRPSQDTIARFVRGNGTAKKRDSGGEELKPIAEESEVDERPPSPAKPPAPAARDEIDALDDVFDDEDLDIDSDMLERLEKVVEEVSWEKPARRDRESSPKAALATGGQKEPRTSTRYEEDLGLKRRKLSESPPRSAARLPVLPSTPPAPAASPSPSPPRQAPPMSTQAILFNYDDFFPSMSQQARELEEEIDSSAPSSAPKVPSRGESKPGPGLEQMLDELEEEDLEPDFEAQPEPPLEINSFTPPPRRFFTSSGSHEVMCLALHRSRRTAALEQRQREQRAALEAKSARPKTAPAAHPPREAKPLRNTSFVSQHDEPLKRRGAQSQGAEMQRQTAEAAAAKKPSGENNKENIPPSVAKPQSNLPPASQETEYGGDWVDEIALELLV